MLLYAPIAFAKFGKFVMQQLLRRWPDAFAWYMRLDGGSRVNMML